MVMTSVDVDADLLAEAKTILDVRTTREAVNRALGDVVRRRRQLDALALLSTIAVDEDPQRDAEGTTAL